MSKWERGDTCPDAATLPAEPDLHTSLLAEGGRCDDFYQQDGYHPTQVNGLLTSLYFYEVLTGESCENAEYTQLQSTINMFGGEEALEDLMQQGKKVTDDFYDLSMGIE